MEAHDENVKSNHLQELGGSDFEIADGQPNIKGWEVLGPGGQDLGEVAELLFDEGSRKVRYLVLDLAENEWNLEEREVLVPIGLAEIDVERDEVILPLVTPEQLAALPDYSKNDLSLETEIIIRSVFMNADPVSSASFQDNFYVHEHFDEERLYSRRKAAPVKTPHTVIGVFENGFTAQTAIQKLKNSGFLDENIDVSVRGTHHSESEYLNRLSGFFGTLFDDHDEAAHFSKLAAEGSVVTVHTQSIAESEVAMRVLEDYGAEVKDDPEITAGTTINPEPEEGSETFRKQIRTRIIERQVENSKRLRTGI
ncbi:PRC-barrel domain-containing protein [Arcticibacter sp.]|uniref:PRC-barrel domain-containing protein n=1 Tax=Arcticibacter sp. TaxID=1872630 RepID=UPI00388FDC4A